MESLFAALDTVCGLVVTGAVAMIAFAHRELKAARLLLGIASLTLVIRWDMWSFVTATRWWGRALVGALIGALIVAGLPSLWMWSKEREQTLNLPSAPIETSQIPTLGSLRYVIAVMRVSIKKGDLERANTQMEVEIHNDNNFLIGYSAKMNGSVNGKPGPRGEILFNGYVYPNQHGYLVYDTISEVNIADSNYSDKPSILGELEYQVEYWNANNADSHKRKSSKSMTISYYEPINNKSTGSVTEIPVRVIINTEHEE
jgi:hypothetical protein